MLVTKEIADFISSSLRLISKTEKEVLTQGQDAYVKFIGQKGEATSVHSGVFYLNEFKIQQSLIFLATQNKIQLLIRLLRECTNYFSSRCINTLFYLAIKYNSHDLKKYVLESLTFDYGDKKERCFMAASFGDADLLENLRLQYNFSHDVDDGQLLIEAAANNHLEMVKDLQTQGVNANAKNGEALIWAATNGHMQMVQYLQENGLSFNAQEDKVLIGAAANRHLEMVRYFQTQGGSANAQNGWALIEAARNGFLEMVQYLQTQGVSANVRLGAASIWAASSGHLEMVQYLQTQGVNPNAGDGLALIEATLHGHVETVQFLILEGSCRLLQNYTEILRELSRSDSKEIRMLCAKELIFLGYSAVDENVTKDEFERLVDKSLTKGPLPYHSSISEIFRARAIENLMQVLRRQQPLNLIGSETSMDASLMQVARAHFDDVVLKDGDLNVEFERLGGIEGVERKIKEEILERLKKIPAVNTFLTSDVQKSIFSGDESARKDLLNIVSGNNEDIAAIVYRAYEPLAPTNVWPNLFAAPKIGTANEIAFTTAFSLAPGADGNLSRQMESDEIRKMAAYYFLIAQREKAKEGCSDKVLDDWFSYVAETRRAHNHNQFGIDNPSCYPGSVTRLAQIVKSTVLKIPLNIQREVKEYLRQEMVKAFTHHLNTLGSNEGKLKLFDAISGLHYEYSNQKLQEGALKSIFENKQYLASGNEWSNEEYMPIRKLFIERAFGISHDERVDRLLVGMQQKGIEIRPERQSEIILMIEKALIEITHLSAISSITEAYIESAKIEEPAVEPKDKAFVSAKTYLPVSDAKGVASGSGSVEDAQINVEGKKLKKLQP